jgi:hypothetical protein
VETPALLFYRYVKILKFYAKIKHGCKSKEDIRRAAEEERRNRGRVPTT